MCWHFGICLEDRNQQSITFHLALYLSFLLLLLCNNRLRTQQREALDLPAAWPHTFASWHDSSCSILPGHSHLIRAMLWAWGCFGMLLLWRAGSVSTAQPPCPYCLFTCLPQSKGPTEDLCFLWSLLLQCCSFTDRDLHVPVSVLFISPFCLWGCFCLECKPAL